MQKGYKVERMSQDELQQAIAWVAQEGWNPGLADAECFYQADPHGFFAGKLNGKTIAIGSAVIYDECFAFCGLYIVNKHYRGQGYGMELTKQRLAYIGQRNAGIDGVLTMLDNYEKIGYKVAHYNARFSGRHFKPIVKNNPAIIPLNQIDFSTLLQYDRRHFPAQRASFLKCWVKQPKAICLGFYQHPILRGYGVLRACQEGYKIGPLFADHAEIAEELFLHLTQYTQSQSFYLDIPINNTESLDLVNHYKLVKVFETARMYLKEEPKLPINEIFGITTFELG